MGKTAARSKAVDVRVMRSTEVDPKNWTVGFVKTEGA